MVQFVGIKNAEKCYCSFNSELVPIQVLVVGPNLFGQCQSAYQQGQNRLISNSINKFTPLEGLDDTRHLIHQPLPGFASGPGHVGRKDKVRPVVVQ